VTQPVTGHPTRVLPILDLHGGLFFDRHLDFRQTVYRQTLEPEMYYTYVPYRNQNMIPVFDTITNTLNYDQLFNYNRFSGFDRIGDANQISLGITTRLIEEKTGWEKLRAGIGQIFYFRKRSVTIGPPTPEDSYNRSPLSGMITAEIIPFWHLRGDGIWSLRSNQFQNENITLSYRPAPQKVINLGYGFVKGGDINNSNLSATDLSFAWPLSSRMSAIGRWTQNVSHHHFQNLLYGLQYESCCWAVRLVAMKTFTGLNPATNSYQYDTRFALQFVLKGLGSFGNSDPSQLLDSNVPGYQSAFGQIL